MELGAAANPSRVEFWDQLPDQRAYISAKVRGIEVPELSGLDDTAAFLVTREAKLKLADWYRRWGGRALSPPEFLEDDEALEHAEELGIDPPISESTAELKKLRLSILVEHVRRQAEEATEVTGGREDEESEEEARLSHPTGLSYAPKSGRCRDIYPSDGSAVEEVVKLQYGTVLITHRYTGEPEGHNRRVEQEFKVISGLGIRSLGSHKYSFEVTSLDTFQRSTVRPGKLSEMERFTNWFEPMKRYKAGEIEAQPSPSVAHSVSSASFGSQKDRNSWTCVLSGLQVDLDDVGSLIGLPKRLVDGTIDSPQAGERPQQVEKEGSRPVELSQGTQGHVAELRQCLKVAMRDLVSALERDLEPYVQPGMQNLVTGEELDPRATEAERLAALSTAYSQPSPAREVRSFCAWCTSLELARRVKEDPTLDPTNRDLLAECFVWGTNAEDKGCADCGRRLHPNLETPTKCLECGRLSHCAGKLRACCPGCRCSYLELEQDGLAPAATKAQSGDTAQREADNSIYHYIRLTGGDSYLFESAKDVTAARLELRTKCGSFFQEGRDYRITPRHVYYGATLRFSAYPDGRDGLCPRDFIPHRSRLFQALADGADAEGTPGEGGDQKLDVSIFDDGEWSDLPTHERMATWIETNMPTAPNFPVNLDPSTWLAQEGVYQMALSNAFQFIIDAGIRRSWEVKQTLEALFNLGKGTFGLSLPDQEHHGCLTLFSFFDRIRAQCRDFSRSQLYAFEKEDEGWAIRLFYAPTLPRIIQMSRLPKEVAQAQRSAREVYAGRFNNGGMSLSYTRNNKSDLPKSKSKQGQSSKKSKMSTEDLNPAETDPIVTWTAGEVLGDRIPPIGKVKQLTTVAADGQPYCIAFQSKAGCPYEDGAEGVACPCKHEHTKQWHPQIVRVILSLGGFKRAPPLRLSQLEQWMPHQRFTEGSSIATKTDSALRAVDRALERTATGNVEKRPIHDIVNRQKSIQTYKITPAGQSLIPLCSLAGLPAHQMHAVTVGSGVAYVDGNTIDSGGDISLKDGSVLRNRCFVKNVATMTYKHRTFENTPGASVDLELLRQVNDCLLELDPETMPLCSWLTDVFLDSSNAEEDGYSEALWDIIDPAYTAHSNLIEFSQGKLRSSSDLKGLGIRLWKAGPKMHEPRTSWHSNAAYASRFLQTWDWGEGAIDGPITSVLSHVPSPETADRHTMGFQLPTKLNKFNAIIQQLEKFNLCASENVEFVVGSPGMVEAAARKKGRQAWTREQLRAAHARIQADQDLVVAGMLPREVNPHLDRALAQPERSKQASKSCEPTQRRPIFVPPDPPMVEDRAQQRKLSSSHPTWLLAVKFLDRLEQLEETAKTDTMQGLREAIRTMQDLGDELMESEERDPVWPEKGHVRVVGRVLSLLRFIRFGNRMAEGPDPSDIPSRYLNALTRGHRDAYLELITQGHACGKLSSGKGYVGQHRPETEAATYQIWKSFWKTSLQLRSINLHPHHRDPLVKSGVVFAPLGVVEKLNDRKEVRLEDDGITKQLRAVHDHTDGGHNEAHNTGVQSFRTAKQMGTDDSTIAAKFIKEENANPGYFVGISKKDYSGAFTICQDREEDVGLRASEHMGVLNVNGSLTFGGADAPGVWENQGSAPSDASSEIPWPDSAKDGPTVPRHDRCTDDTFHEVAFRGNRQERYMQAFEQLMRVFAGRSANNTVKDGESGGFTPKQHAFGSLVDSFRRRFISPLSRLCRVEPAIQRYLADPQLHFTGAEVASVRGSLDSCLKNAPQLKDLVMPRFDAMLSDIAVQHGTKTPPDDFEPSPAIGGETPDQGKSMLKMAMSVVWRFVTLGNGKYIYRSFEECLEREYRDAWPGKEGPGSSITGESDSSGQGIFYFDPVTGKYIQRWFTKAERAQMFKYDEDSEDIIITNLEFLAPAEGLPLTIFDHPQATYVVLRNDNQNVVDNINSGKAGNMLNLECLMFLKLLSFLLGKMIYAVYVRSEDNKRSDSGTRKDLQQELEGLLQKWEGATGKCRQQIHSSSNHITLDSWVEQSHSPDFEARMNSVWLKLLEVLEGSLVDGHAWQFKVPVPEAMQVIKDALAGTPVPLLDRSCDDYPLTEGPSTARQHVEQCAAAGVLTRTNLIHKVKHVQGFREQLTKRVGVDLSTPDQKLFSLALQQQFDTTMSPQWSECKRYNPTATKITGPPVVNAPHSSLERHIRIGENYAGQASFSKSGRDSGGAEVVYLSERNPAIHPHLESEFPEAKIFSENEAVTAQYITEQGIEGVTGGPPCQDHSQGSHRRRGNGTGSRSGREFQEAGYSAAAAYKGTGVAWQLWECAPGVHHCSKGGGKSPYQQLLDNNPGFHDALEGKVLRADRIRSPLTEKAAPSHHSRAYVLLVNDVDFPADAKINLTEVKESLSPTWAHNRETDEQTPGRFVMPIEDASDFLFNSYESGGVAYTGNIRDPPSGYGNGSFPTKGTDPQNGLALTFTTGGGKWIQNEHNGLPAFTHVSVREAAANYQLRGLPDELLDPWSWDGRETVSHAVLGNMADALMCALFDLYLEPMSLEQSKAKGFDFRISPRDHFLLRTKLITFTADNNTSTEVSKNTGVSAEDIREQWNATAKVREMKKKVRLHTHKNGIRATNAQSSKVASEPRIQKAKKQKKRPAPVITASMNAKLDKHMQKVRNPKLKKTQDGQARHYIEFFKANGWPALIEDPTHPLEQYRLKRWISYEHEIQGIKGDSIKAKFPAINKFHKAHGKLPPFEYALDAVAWASELKRGDLPSQPKLCVPKQLIEVHAIEQDLTHNCDVEAEVCAMATAVDYCLRSLEYTEQDNGKVDPRALHWRDVTLKDVHGEVLTGWSARKCKRMTLSLLSSKNSLRRCTRTAHLLEHEFTNSVRLIRNRYLRIVGETGTVPDPNAPVFQYTSGRTVSRRRVSQIIQDLMASVGVPRRFVASHSLRRTGASLLAATGLASDEDIKRWGRWTSNAYKLYVHLENSRYKAWAEAVARIKPVFELN